MRFDHVAIALNGNPVVLTWTGRQALLQRLQHVKENTQIRAAFSAGSASRPVQLRPAQRTALLLALEVWSVGLDGYEPIPQELLDLRSALLADLHSANRASRSGQLQIVPPNARRPRHAPPPVVRL
jgi:hypothetical protein